MATKKAQAEQERQESIDYLRSILKPGSEVFTILRHVSSSGMTRHIDLMTVVDGEIRCISYRAAIVMGMKLASGRGQTGIKISGCGMDMGFALVYDLGRYLWPKGFDLPEERRGRNGDTSGHDDDGGYALVQRWL